MGENEVSFEEAFSRLEDIVAQLEEGGLDLEESVSLFERGMALTKQCERKLREAELQVEQLVADAEGESELMPFT